MGAREAYEKVVYNLQTLIDAVTIQRNGKAPFGRFSEERMIVRDGAARLAAD
jgi:hypothetical protein